MIGTVTPSGVAVDIIDALMYRTTGEVLSTPAGATGGEYDCWPELVDRRGMRRLVAAGLVSRLHGLPADRLAEVAGWDGTPDTFVAWYLGQALAGLDARADRRSGTPWECQERPADDTPGTVGGELPACVLEYLDRLVFGDKLTYAAGYAWHLWDHTPTPADPGTEWAGKVRHKLDAMHRRHR